MLESAQYRLLSDVETKRNETSLTGYTLYHQKFLKTGYYQKWKQYWRKQHQQVTHYTKKYSYYLDNLFPTLSENIDVLASRCVPLFVYHALKQPQEPNNISLKLNAYIQSCTFKPVKNVKNARSG